MRDLENLLALKKAHLFAVRVQAIAILISRLRYPGLSDQLIAAAHSVAANIAEGAGHSSRREFARFLQIALASSGEVAYHLEYARDTHAISAEVFAELDGANREVGLMLASLLRVVRDELTRRDGGTSNAAMQGRRFAKSDRALPTANNNEPGD